MDYLEQAREAYEGAQAAKRDGHAEEYYRCADTCALIAIAEQLKKLNESLADITLEAEFMEMSYVPQV